LTSTSSRDRYPYLFNEAKRYAEVFLKEKELSILSFGCSTGEECISLKSYFPESRIVGVDINKSNIRKADKNNFSPGITYILSTPENIADKGKYDLIFCLSVLCRWEETKSVENCEKIYSF
jgi:chemotaxis methyl-accepting protein methylase